MPDDDQNDDAPDQEPGRLRGMYESEKQARADAETQLAALQRREVFRDAGLDPSRPLHSALIRGYDGELAADKVKEYVDGLGLEADTPAPAPLPPTTDEQQAAHQRIAAAGAGDGTPPPDPDHERRFRADMEAAYRKGDIQALDRISMQYSRDTGHDTVDDLM